MDYTIRIIKPLNGTNESSNYSIGSHYSTYYATHIGDALNQNQQNVFDKMRDDYFSHSPVVLLENDKVDEVMGFVSASDGTLYPFWDHYEVYIVNESGKTFERVYGMPKKR